MSPWEPRGSGGGGGESGEWTPVLVAVAKCDAPVSPAAFYYRHGGLVSAALAVEVVSTESATEEAPMLLEFSLPAPFWSGWIGGVTAAFAGAEEEETYGISCRLLPPTSPGGSPRFAAYRWTGGNTPMRLDIWCTYREVAQ